MSICAKPKFLTALGGVALAAAFATAFGPLSPVAAVEATGTGGVVIQLTDSTGMETEAASAGFDTSRTTSDGDEAGAAEGTEDFEVLTAPISVEDPFSVAGVTWTSGQELPVGSSVQMRTLDDEVWSDWFALETEDEPGTRSGTEMNVSGGSTGLQVRITKGTGALPTDLRIDVSYTADDGITANDGEDLAEVLPTASSVTDDVSNTETQDLQENLANTASSFVADDDSAYARSVVVQTVASTSASKTAIAKATATANVQPRSAWGADESIMTWKVTYATFQGVIVHHTAGSNTYTQAQVKSTIQGIYRYHAVTNGWGDIGYNVLIDRFGGRWEGRSGTLASANDQMAVGAHAVPRNTGTMGVSVMGNYAIDGVTPSSTVLTSLEDVIAWKFVVAAVDPRSTSPLTVPLPSEKVINSSLTPGSALPRIVGHRDVSSTVCPGSIYNSLSTIRTAVATKYDAFMAISDTPTASPTTTAPTTAAPTSAPTTAAPSAGTTFYLNDAWTGQANTTFSWGEATDEVLVGDWDGDGKDTIAIRRGTRFAFTNSTTPTGAPEFTMVYGRADDEVLVGDWDGDGKDTIAVRRDASIYVRNSLSTGQAEKSFTFGRATDAAFAGDWDGDGKDTVAVRRSGRFYILNVLASGTAELNFAYGKDTDAVFAGHFGKNSKTDSFAVRRGSTYYVTENLQGGTADWSLIYGRVSDETLVGDWNGDGLGTLGVRR